ncbi:hypothetical protein SAMN05428975_1941 [Mucilaginibacter sp. OK268]|nr:hypothetical protein SAMN05428975_1941 [Mucilaginibacter sp. OK268]
MLNLFQHPICKVYKSILATFLMRSRNKFGMTSCFTYPTSVNSYEGYF